VEKIIVLGNIVVDQEYVIDEPLIESGSHSCISHCTSVGGIMNMLNPFVEEEMNPWFISSVGMDSDAQIVFTFCDDQSIDKEFFKSIGLFPLYPTSCSLILSNNSNSTRTSAVQWGACTKTELDSSLLLSSTASRHLHISYIDKLDKITAEELKNLRRQAPEFKISIDLCLNSHSEEEIKRILGVVMETDLVIISDMEARSVTGCQDLEKCVKILGEKARGGCIVHTPRKSLISEGADPTEVEAPGYLENVSVLGAGDMFCAYYLSHCIKAGGDLLSITALEYSHSKVLEKLKRKIK
jgi:sugar/nucleoside kinase (ribokinase family)